MYIIIEMQLRYNQYDSAFFIECCIVGIFLLLYQKKVLGNPGILSMY